MASKLRFVIIGGSDAGISAALRARELDRDVSITVLLADGYPNFSICGLPFFLSGETPDWHQLALEQPLGSGTSGRPKLVSALIAIMIGPKLVLMSLNGPKAPITTQVMVHPNRTRVTLPQSSPQAIHIGGCTSVEQQLVTR